MLIGHPHNLWRVFHPLRQGRNDMKKFSAVLGVVTFFGLFGIPNSVLGQENTAAKIISDVIGVGKDSFLKVGQGLTGLGSWVTPGGKYRDPLTRTEAGAYEFLNNASDHDLRLVLPEGTSEEEALKIYQEVRSQFVSRVRASFGNEAERVLQSINIYPPEQLMKGVEREAAALQRLDELGVITPNLGGKAPEGLFTPGRFEYARGYEKSGRLFYNSGGKMKQGFADILSDVVSGAEDVVPDTLRGASSNAEAFAKKAYTAFLEKKPQDLVKNLERAQVNLQKSRAILKDSGTLAKSSTSQTSSLYSDVSKVVDADPILANPATEQKILQYTKQVSLESRLLGRLETASAAEKELILRWLGEMGAGAGVWDKMWGVFEKVPMQEIGRVLETLFLFYEGYVISGKLGEGDLEGALKETELYATFIAAGLGPGLAVMAAGLLLDQAKSFGYDLMASTQDCEDLLIGVFTVRGREVNILDSNIRGLTIDDLVLLYQNPSDILNAIAVRARLAAGRGLGEATGGSDADVEKRLNDRCGKEIIKKWNRKRDELDGQLAKLAASVANNPIAIAVTPDPAVFTSPNVPHILRAKVEMPLAEIADMEQKMGFLLDRLAGQHQYAIQIRYDWAVDGKSVERDYPDLDFEVDAPGRHEIRAEMTFNILPGLSYSRTFHEVKKSALAIVDCVFPGTSAKPENKPKLEAPPEKNPPEKPPVDVKKPGDKAPAEKPPAEKPPAGTLPPTAKEKPTPAEKPTTATPPPGAPPVAAPGSTSPSSGTAAGGYWKLTDVQDQAWPSPLFPKFVMNLDQDNGVPTVTFAGDSVISRIKGDSLVIDMKKPQGERLTRAPFDYQSGLSWSEPPKTIAPGVTVSMTLRLSWSPADITTKGIDGGVVPMSGEQINVNAGAPLQTVQWRSAPPPPQEAAVFPGLLNSSVTVNHTGVGGGGARKYTYTWTPGVMPATSAAVVTAPISGAFSVDVKSDKPTPKLGDTVTLSTQVTGGTAPYTYSWTGPATGTSAALPFTVSKPGRQDFIVTVIDAKGAKTSAAASVEAKAFTATISLVGSGLPVRIGQTLSFQAQVSSPDGAAPPAGLVYRWQPNPEVTFAPFEDTKNTTTGRFPKMGKLKVWVDVLQKSGTVLSTIAESNQLEIEVVKPEISLRSSPAEPKPGQEVRITATESPAVGDAFISYWWEYTGNVINPGALVDQRVYSYKPKDTAPVTVTVHGKAKDGGDDLGQKSITLTAKPYEVKIDEPRLMGPPPRVWSEQAKGLVEVPRAIGTFQDFYVKASVSPTPPDPSLRYVWLSQPEGCSIYSPASQETRGNASQAGTFNISVTVRDNQDITLGSGSRTVTIVAPTTEPKKPEPVKPPSKTAEAMVKLKEASALAVDGKLDEAIVVAEQAAALDPNSKPISSYLQQLKATKAQQSNLQQQNKAAAQAPTAPPKSKTAAATPSKADQAADLLKQAYDLNLQSKTDEALALSEEALRLDPDSKLAVTYIQLLQATKKKKAEAASQQAAIQTATQHLNQAQSLGKAGRLDEADAEVAAAKKDYPSHSQIPVFEKWLQQLRQQRDAADAAAKAAAGAKKQQGPPELAGTQWEGTASITAEGGTASWPFRISIDGTNQISGEMTLTFPGVEGSQKLDLQGMYDSGNGAFKMTGIAAEEGVNFQLTLAGAATSAALAEGKITVKVQMQGIPDATINGTWRISRR
jgi:tetratricopeptide (TPR) repeat protein